MRESTGVGPRLWRRHAARFRHRVFDGDAAWPRAGTAVAAATVLACAFINAFSPRRLAIDTAITLAATQAASFAYFFVHGVPGMSVWRWIALPVAAGALGYQFSQALLAQVVVPVVSRRPMAAGWFGRTLSASPLYLLGAAAAAIVVGVVDARLWSIAPVVFAGLDLRVFDLRRLRAAPRG